MKAPKPILLTLVEAPAVEADAVKHLAESGLDDYVKFYSIHAETAGLSTKNNYEVDNPGSGFNMGVKPTGIYIAHRMVWAAALMMDADHFLIMETDVKFDPDWKERYVKALMDVPKDFDFLFIGSCCAAGKPSAHIAGEIYDVRYPQCLHAYVVAKKALLPLIKMCAKCWAPIDIQLVFEAFDKLKVYTLLPSAAAQFNNVIWP